MGRKPGPWGLSLREESWRKGEKQELREGDAPHLLVFEKTGEKERPSEMLKNSCELDHKVKPSNNQIIKLPSETQRCSGSLITFGC